MKPKFFKVKDEKGSITLFIVIAILFFLIILFGRVYSTSNLNTAQLKEVEQIQKQYTVTEDDLERAYSEAIKQEHPLKVGDFVNYELSDLDNEKVTTLNSDVNTYSGYDSQQTITRTDTTTKDGKTYLLCRVLEIDKYGNPSKLISADGINSLGLKGANGYNNGVYLINEMCDTLYSGNQGTTKSLKIEDLEDNYFSQTAIDTRDAYTIDGVTYGQTRYYSSRAQYPNIALEEAGMGIGTTLVNGKNQIREGGLGKSQQTITYTGSGDAAVLDNEHKGITVPLTYYRIEAVDENYKSDVLNNIMHKKLTSNSEIANVTDYWLASRCADSSRDAYGRFLLRAVYYAAVDGSPIYFAYGGSSSRSYSIRPIINLKAGIQAEYAGEYNGTYNLWNLN